MKHVLCSGWFWDNVVKHAIDRWEVNYYNRWMSVGIVKQIPGKVSLAPSRLLVGVTVKITTWCFLFFGSIPSIFTEFFSLEAVSLAGRSHQTMVFDKKLHQVPVPRCSWLTHTDWRILSLWSTCWCTIWSMCSLVSVNTAKSFLGHSESSSIPRWFRN